MESSGDLRPRDFALLMLGSGDLRPRQRARDQQADQAGLELLRRLLNELAALDPEPEELEPTLARLVAEVGPATGPARALALTIRQDWELARADQAFLQHLLEQAVQK